MSSNTFSSILAAILVKNFDYKQMEIFICSLIRLLTLIIQTYSKHTHVYLVQRKHL
jgi:hypothetical protein